MVRTQENPTHWFTASGSRFVDTPARSPTLLPLVTDAGICDPYEDAHSHSDSARLCTSVPQSEPGPRFSSPISNFVDRDSSCSDLVRILSLVQASLVRVVNLPAGPTSTQDCGGEKIAVVKGVLGRDRTLIAHTVTVIEWDSFFIL